MPSPQVNALHVTNNNPGLVNMILVESNGTEIPLDPGASIHPSKEQVIDLTLVKGLNDGDTFTVRVRVYHSGQTADNDTVLTYVDSVAKQGIYTVDGSITAPKLNYAGTGPNPKPPVPTDTLVQALYVTNKNPGLVNIILVLSNGTEIPLDPGASIQPSGNQFLDLTLVKGLYDGDTFTVRVRVYHSGQTADDDTILTYLDTADKQGVYTVGGTTTAPEIKYVGGEALKPAA